MYLSEQEFDHLAKLSKLTFSHDEKQKVLQNMEGIIGFLDKLKTVDETVIEDGEHLHCFDKEESYQYPKELLSNSKHQKGDYISVKTAIKK